MVTGHIMLLVFRSLWIIKVMKERILSFPIFLRHHVNFLGVGMRGAAGLGQLRREKGFPQDRPRGRASVRWEGEEGCARR